MAEASAVKNQRDLVLAPNEYAYVQNETKGTIGTYVGPYKYTPEGTDCFIRFNMKSKKFEQVTIADAKHLFVIAPTGYYVLLKNPARDEGKIHPRRESVDSTPALFEGKKVNIQGPTSFALWPGQMARLVKGHDLRSNQYLIVRVYDEDAAKVSWAETVAKKADGEDVKLSMPDLVMGKLLIIRGTEVSFYIPPTGLEVVPEKGGEYTRDAVTLERLEYCILLGEDGNKRYIYGPDVVFPEPTEVFVEDNGRRKFKQIELTVLSGAHVKAITDYVDEDGTKVTAGTELFITGKEQPIYRPRPEHAAMRYGDGDFIHYAITIPAGEARYVLDRDEGKIFLQRGPCMYLPDPRRYVIIRRVLAEDMVSLCFPGNTQALEYNRGLKALASMENATPDGAVSDRLLKSAYRSGGGAVSKGLLSMDSTSYCSTNSSDLDWSAAEATPAAFVGDEFSRKTKFTPPRTVTLDTKYDGAVRIDVWTGYAVLVKSATGTRKIVVGPQTYLLEYDETLEAMELSTGKPKTTDKKKKTVYLRVLHNKVSDIVRWVETKDMCKVELKLSYLVNFEGDENKWFDVENYVKFLTDHARSILKNVARRYTIGDFFANAIDIIRDSLLGKASDETKRPGLAFPENGMRVYDLEVLDVVITDENVSGLLVDAQKDVIEQTITIKRKENELAMTEKVEAINRDIREIQTETNLKALELEITKLMKQHERDLTEAAASAETEMKTLEETLKQQAKKNEISTVELDRYKEKEDRMLEVQKAKDALSLEKEKERVRLVLEQMQAEVEGVKEKALSITPEMVQALQAFSDKALAGQLAESLGSLSILEDRSVIQSMIKVFSGVPAVSEVLSKFQAQSTL